jgi:hypothetical protein
MDEVVVELGRGHFSNKSLEIFVEQGNQQLLD